MEKTHVRPRAEWENGREEINGAAPLRIYTTEQKSDEPITPLVRMHCRLSKPWQCRLVIIILV